MVVRKCEENDKDALRWCIEKPDKRKSRKMSNKLFSAMSFFEKKNGTNYLPETVLICADLWAVSAPLGNNDDFPIEDLKF